MKKWKILFTSWKQRCFDALYNLGIYYQTIKNYNRMKKYYLMAGQKGHSDALYALGLYYQSINNFDKMNKYYLLAIKKTVNN